MMVSFIDAHRGRYGVGPLCAQVPIAPSTYYAHKAREAEPERVSARARRDGWLSGEIRRVYDEHFQVYGVRKVWRQLRGEGVTVARCTVARLMRRMGLQGAVRGRRVKTTRAVVHGERPADRVNREFQVRRPNALWVSDPRFHHSGAGSDLRGDMARVRLHGLRHRRLCAAYPRFRGDGLAGVELTAHGPGPRCPRTGPS